MLTGCTRVSPSTSAVPTPGFPSDAAVDQLCADSVENFAPSENNTDFALARYTADGLLDQSFGLNGTTVVDFGSTREAASAVLTQSDGKTVLVGYSDSSLALARLTIDGALDETFGEAGRTVTPLLSEAEAEAIAAPNPTPTQTANALVLPDGKILVAAERGAYDLLAEPSGFAPYQLALARYTADGQLDDSFGDGGLAVVQVESNPDGQALAHALAMQPDGHFLVAGEYSANGISGTPSQLLLARFTPDGALDTGFGNGGTVVRNNHYDDVALALAVDDAGAWIGGYQRPRFGPNFPLQDEPFVWQLLRLQNDGTLNSTFDASADFATTRGTSIHSLHVLEDGTLLAAGVGQLARYRSDGSLAGTFGEGGVIRARDMLFGSDMVMRDKHLWLLGGGAPGMVNHCPNVARYTLDGAPDATFGEDGLVALSDGLASHQAIAVQADGSLAVAGAALEKQ